MVEEEEGGVAVLTAGCLGLAGSEFQCRVSVLHVWNLYTLFVTPNSPARCARSARSETAFAVL